MNQNTCLQHGNSLSEHHGLGPYSGQGTDMQVEPNTLQEHYSNTGFSLKRLFTVKLQWNHKYYARQYAQLSTGKATMAYPDKSFNITVEKIRLTGSVPNSTHGLHMKA